MNVTTTRTTKTNGENAAKTAIKKETAKTRRHENLSICHQPSTAMTKSGSRMRITTVASLPELIAEIETGEIAYNKAEEAVIQRLSDSRLSSK